MAPTEATLNSVYLKYILDVRLEGILKKLFMVPEAVNIKRTVKCEK